MTYYILQGTDPNDKMSWNATVWDTEPVGFEWMTKEQYAAKFPLVIEEPKPPTEEQLAVLAQQQAQAEATQIIQTAIQQHAVQTMSFAATDFAVLAKAGLFEDWQPGKDYTQGQRFAHQGVVYEVQQMETTQTETESTGIQRVGFVFPAMLIPGQPGSETLYKPLSVTE